MKRIWSDLDSFQGDWQGSIAIHYVQVPDLVAFAYHQSRLSESNPDVVIEIR
jgi:hypothetical protein